jgi:hypothetical protein
MNVLRAELHDFRAELEGRAALVASLAADKAKSEERCDWLGEEVARREQRIGDLETERERL